MPRVLVAAGLAAVVGCSTPTDTAAPMPTSPFGEEPSLPITTPPPASPLTRATPEIWRFSARQLGGDTVDGSVFAGKKVAVWLWAPWCPPCNRLAPTVATVSREYSDIVFIGIPGQDSDDAHQRFVDEHGLGHIVHLVDERRRLWGHFGSATQEAWLFISDDGEVGARTRYGEMEPDQLRGYLDDLRDP